MARSWIASNRRRSIGCLAPAAAVLTLLLTSVQDAGAQFAPGELPGPERPQSSASIYEVLTVPDRSPRGTARNAVSPDQLYEQGQRFWQGTDVPKDSAETAYWLKLEVASRIGTREQNALNLLAFLNVDGNGVKTDPVAARLLWELSAAGGNGTAMYNLGYLYENGIGVTTDRDRARTWYERARAAGYEKAEDALARLKQ